MTRKLLVGLDPVHYHAGLSPSPLTFMQRAARPCRGHCSALVSIEMRLPDPVVGFLLDVTTGTSNDSNISARILGRTL